jgi:transcriptional regulator NrdR family protein
MTWIIKRISGSREEFEADKIRKALTKAYIDAELIPEDHSKEIGKIVSEAANHYKNGDAIPSTHIRDSVVAKLEKIEPKAADAWKRFEKKYKKKNNL